MSKSNLEYIKKTCWQESRNDVQNACPELSSIIDEIDPSNDLSLIKVEIPFGAEILKNMISFLPSENGTMLPIADSRFPKNIVRDLNYNSVPLGIVVKNSIEVYREIDQAVFSLAHNVCGLEHGIWEFFGWTTPYNVCAGARSLFMIPKISSTILHKKLKQAFGVSLPSPKHLCDHWEVFKQIANSDNFHEEWHCEIIFLTRKWVENIRNNKSWEKLHNHLLKKGWEHSGYGRKKSILDHTWDMFARKLSAKGFKATPYVVDTLKHLIILGTQTIPGSAPFAGEEKSGPLKGLQAVYHDCYGLENYFPTIMEPHYLSKLDRKKVYYSLQAPTLLESTPRSKNIMSKMDAIRELRELMKYFLEEGFDNRLIFAGTSMTDIIQKLQFKFYHNEMYTYGSDIRPSNEMPEQDNNLLYSSLKTNNQTFANSGPFVQGCVCIEIHDD